ncbi:MAG: putative hemolysin [Labilithrix sp.]|nr:putative hemolysin [Labilithrix sp.]
MARALGRLSADEIAAAVLPPGTRAPEVVRAAVRWVAGVPSRRLGAALARFDANVATRGLPAAARALLSSFGATVEVVGALPPGPALVVTNHPGAYDAIALMAALDREDVALVAADRAFLRAMPAVARHLVFASSASAFARLAGLRAALAWLAAGRTLVHFGAGRIEPDVRFGGADAPLAPVWAAGTGVLARHAIARGASVVPAFVSGVHSPRAKRLPFVRWGEARGITTLAPLVQATVPGFADVAVRVRLGDPVPGLAGRTDVECTEMLRARCAALAR